MALFDNDTAQAMIRAGYAFNLSDEMLAEYNSLVDAIVEAPVFPPEGWLPHPTSAGWYYKGTEVKSEADLRATVK